MGFFKDSKGYDVGYSNASGLWGRTERSYDGKIYEDGTITNKYGRIEGTIDNRGRVWDRYGHLTDYTYED